MNIKRLFWGVIFLPLMLSACAYDPQSPFYPEQGVINNQNYPDPIYKHRHRKEHHKGDHLSPAPHDGYDPHAGSGKPEIGQGVTPAPRPVNNQPTPQYPVPRPATNQPLQHQPAPRPADNHPNQQQPAPRTGSSAPGKTQVPIGRGAV